MIFCEALLALGFEVSFCKPPTKAPEFETDDNVFDYKLPPKPKEESIITFPPIVVDRLVELPPTSKEAPPPPKKTVKRPVKKPPPPNPAILYAHTASLHLRRTSKVEQVDFVQSSSAGAAALPQDTNLSQVSRGVVSAPTPEATPSTITVQNYIEAKYPTDEEYTSPKSRSSLPVPNDRILTADRYIVGILETGINSQIGTGEGGSIIIQTSRDVFGYHSRNILIPKGSRMICDYATPEEPAQSRLNVTCTRILLGEHRAEIRQIVSKVTDQQGRYGLAGNIDRRFWEKYGTALAITGLSATVSGINNYLAHGRRSAAGESVSGATEEVTDQFGQITAQALHDSAGLKPIVTISQGTRVVVRPQSDWYIQQVE